ncbi:MAG: biliverdin-producing heme oxygenase [Alphaproteobacteria bacterium]|nr:biliverdin-producing heme oxygenase [Alphaproteobacteria bacterium]
MTSVRDRLREATAEIHQALHGAAPFARIAEGEMDRQGYGALLQMLHRYHVMMAGPCEAGAAALAAPELALAHRARIAALEQDMAFLGVKPERGAVDIAGNAGFCIGCLYTVQGSTLGGKVIFRQLDRLLPTSDGRRFFEGTPQDSAHWRLLCQKLEQQDRLCEVVEGAHHAFARFGALVSAVSENPVPRPRSPASGARLIQSA